MVVEPVTNLKTVFEIVHDQAFELVLSKHMVVPMVHGSLLVFIFHSGLDELRFFWLGVHCRGRLGCLFICVL